jgi:flavin reductase (DIM6/NTAB) family NADH-FMN oxidoreductase RutF
MISIIPSETPHQKFHQYLLGSIAPRPIAFASTVDARGRPNLSPFSFFNVFGYNPSTLIFSPSRRGRDNTTKDTYENLKAVPEVVINVVTFDMVNQVSLASTEYPKGVNEFTKSGFTMLPSEKVRPFRVRESPVQMECKVRQIIETGEEGGAGMLVICEILVMHINEDVLGADGLPDPNKLKLVGRLGKDYYIKAFGDGLFEVEKPLRTIGIGIDSLPEKVRNSGLLSGNELGRLGNLESLPAMDEIERIKSDEMVVKIMEQVPDQDNALALYAKQLLAGGKVREALCVLLI